MVHLQKAESRRYPAFAQGTDSWSSLYPPTWRSMPLALKSLKYVEISTPIMLHDPQPEGHKSWIQKETSADSVSKGRFAIPGFKPKCLGTNIGKERLFLTKTALAFDYPW